MSKFIIQGSDALSGEIAVKGAKNAALKIIPAALLSTQPLSINNLPKIEDVDRSLELIQALGGSVQSQNGSVILDTARCGIATITPELAKKIRTSIMFVGPLLARLGEVRFPHPGGCTLASGAKRPIDLFLEGFAAMGAEISIEDGFYHLKAGRLRGARYFFTKISVTSTEALMMTAVLAEGTTILRNCAMEPEIRALADYLNQQGARIKGAGTPTIEIEGVSEIGAGTIDIIPDRIETGTFAILAAATHSDITITKCHPNHIEILLQIFSKIGIRYEAGNDYIHILPAAKILPYSIMTHEYPGFPTDLQAPYTVLMTQAAGSSLIHETIYDRRLLYTDMLAQMGADIIMCDPHRVVVNGPSKLAGKRLTSPDIRAGIAMIIAALIAEGETEIDNIYQIDRGYEDIDSRLRTLGADIRRIGTLNL